MAKGKCIVLSAPSGSGKTTLAKQLLQNKSLQLAFSISATSREPRANEKHGVDYFFISPEHFKNRSVKGILSNMKKFTQAFFTALYVQKWRDLWSEGKHVIFDIDVEGGLQSKNNFQTKR